MVERRRAPRYNCDFEVRYSTDGIASVESYTIAKNISRYGICIPVSHVVKKGDTLRLNINTSDNESSITATGKVVWTGDIENPPLAQLNAGIEFIQVDPNDVEMLIKSAARF